MHIFLIRHGRQNSRACNADVPLSEAGMRQAELLALRLSSMHIDLICSSPLQRAAGTAQIVEEKLRVPLQILSELREIDYGELTGLDMRTRFTQYHDTFVQQNSGLRDLPYPGGENLRDVWNRVQPALASITSSGVQNAAVITHAGVIRAILGGILGLDFSRCRLFSGRMEHTSLQDIEFRESDGLYRVCSFNDASHLLPYPELLFRNWPAE